MIIEKRSSTDVLVIGAGPVGLTLANSLARCGVTVRIIEQGAALQREVRAKGLKPRTEEIFEDLGVDQIHVRGQRNPLMRFYQREQLVREVDYASGAAYQSTPDMPYRGSFWIRQNNTQAVLQESLTQKNIKVEFDSHLLTMTQQDDCVLAQVIHAGEMETIQARYLVGCEPFPHKLFAETFGLALKFWHGCALTAWFFCEGPSSRTDLAGLAEYYRKDVQALKEMGTPINERIFADLIKAEARLGQPQPFTRQVTTSQEYFGRTITSTRIHGTQRKGFEKLRDIISSYRCQWAERYLDHYLQKRWEIELREAAHSYKFSSNQKGSPPTVKKFAKDVNAAWLRTIDEDERGISVWRPATKLPEKVKTT